MLLYFQLNTTLQLLKLQLKEAVIEEIVKKVIPAEMFHADTQIPYQPNRHVL